MIKRMEYLQKLISFKDKQLIKVVTGIRRCGKSTLLELYREYLKENDVVEEQIISVNFEDIKFEELKDYKKMYEYIENKLCKDKITYVFLDEVQNVAEFQKAVDSLFLKKNIDIYITGSNAYMLSGELATLLSGRYVEIEMLPLSFKEYLEFSKGELDLKTKLNEYIELGSFPYISELDKNKDAIYDYLRGVYSTVLLKDIATRNKINDIMVLESIIKYIFHNVGNICSIKKISDTLTSNGRNISVHTVEAYIEALKDSYIIYEANRYDIKGKQHLKTLEKYYVVDIGLRNMLLSNKETDVGHILENIVYLELIRRGYKVNIGKIADKEVDFIATNQKDTIYYQVAASVLDPNTLGRELEPLDKIPDHNPKYLITMDELEASYNGIKKINIINFLLKK